jgi:hypothetical protein
MLEKTPWALLTASSFVAAVLAGACAVNTTGDCAENGTCAPADASADATMQPDVMVAIDSGDASDAGTGAGGDADAADAPLEAFADANDAGDGSVDADANADADAAPGCNPAVGPAQDPCVLDPLYGVFVATNGLDTNPGTPVAPVQTIGAGISKAVDAGIAHVYVCAGTYVEPVRITSAVSVFGGLGCPGGGLPWAYDGGIVQLVAGSNLIPLTIDTPDASLAIQDLRVSAASVSLEDDAGNGESSIAVLVNGSTVAFSRCRFTSGTGAPGHDGVTPANYMGGTAAQGGMPNMAAAGGAGGSSACGDGTSSIGGTGGSGMVAMSLVGGMGSSQPPTTQTTNGFDGVGGSGGLVTCGQSPDPGANGAPGLAATVPTAFGSWSDAGWIPAAGGGGANGNPGQGGGGGGGKTNGLGGGGGGAGGCGGAGGTGGGGGGSSIALLAVRGTVTLDTNCLLTSANAGPGGKGGDGQPGQGGGSFAVATCPGAFGGNGAGGGGGAGGAGGVSACVVSQGSAVPLVVPCFLHGNGGLGGAGGKGGAGGDLTPTQNDPAPPGPDGDAGPTGAGASIYTVP